jgi:hypothetical protein
LQAVLTQLDRADKPGVASSYFLQHQAKRWASGGAAALQRQTVQALREKVDSGFSQAAMRRQTLEHCAKRWIPAFRKQQAG